MPKNNNPPGENNHGLSFIHSTLDDAGLDAYAFRIYTHIARRAGSRGTCTESIPNMAKFLNFGVETVRQRLLSLVKNNFLGCEEVTGAGKKHWLRPASEWITPSCQTVGVSGGTTTAPRKGTTTAPRKGTTTAPRKGNPSRQTGGKGSPSEGAPSKGSPIKELGESPRIKYESEATKIINEIDPMLDDMKSDYRLHGFDGKLNAAAQADWDKLIERKRDAQELLTGIRPTKQYAETSRAQSSRGYSANARKVPPPVSGSVPNNGF